MMKVLLQLGLLALVETKWVRTDSPFQSNNERELEEEGNQLQEHVISKLLRNLQKLDDKRELAAENNEADNLEDHSSEGHAKGETIWIRNDSPLQSISEEESGEKGSQYQKLVISKFLRSLEKRLKNEENNRADSSIDHRSENNRADSSKDHRSENNRADSSIDHRSENNRADSSIDHRSEPMQKLHGQFHRLLPMNGRLFRWDVGITSLRLSDEERKYLAGVYTWMRSDSSLKHAVNNTSTLHRRGTKLKYKFVQINGVISSKLTSGPAIEVAATPYVSDNAHNVAATTVARVTKHMPPSIFQTLATNAKVGLFTKAETLTVYSEYAGLATPPGCESSCSGYCRNSCTSDGRKYSSLAGVGGMRAVVVDDNVLCNSNDPYYQQSNILVHEFAHAIHSYGLPYPLQRRINSAYYQAKARSTWQQGAYSMATDMEYFAEASQSFFAAERLTYTTGGMNKCDQFLCRTEAEVRQHIKERDPELYAILSEVYTNNRPSLPGNVGVCTKV